VQAPRFSGVAVAELAVLSFVPVVVPLALTATVAVAVSDAEASMRVMAITLTEIFILSDIYKNLRSRFI
jgi:hypothetical protein